MAGADGGSHVREDQPAFEDIRPTVPFHCIHVVQLVWQPHFGQGLPGEMSLEAPVVDGEHRCHPVGERVPFSEGSEVDHRQGGMPIVHMQENRCRPRHYLRKDLDCCGCQEGEPEMVIGVVRSTFPIYAFPTKKILVLQEKDPRTLRACCRLPQVSPIKAGSDRYRKWAPHGL